MSRVEEAFRRASGETPTAAATAVTCDFYSAEAWTPVISEPKQSPAEFVALRSAARLTGRTVLNLGVRAPEESSPGSFEQPRRRAVEEPEAVTSLAATTDLHRFWFAIQEKEWSSLAIVPVDSTVRMGKLAEELADIGTSHASRLVRHVDAVGAALADTQPLIDAIQHATHTESVIVGVDPFADNPAALPIVRATAAVIFVARLGESRLSSARRAVEAIDHERVLGSVLLTS